MTTQSIIVYRNPLEQAMWEGFMAGDFFPIIVGIVVFFTVFLLLNTFVLEKFYGWGARKTPTNIALAASAFIGFFTIWYMV